MLEAALQTVECDVLVIGAGATGLSAALAAAEAGASVAVACKGKAGRGGNTLVALGQFAAVIPYPGSDDSPEIHFQDSLSGGKQINDEALLRVLAERGGPALLELEARGVPFIRSDGELVRRTPGGHSRPRGIPVDNSAYSMATGGLAVTLPLLEAAVARGVRFLESCPVVRVLVEDGVVAGAVAVKGNEPLLIRAGAVIVAAGGAGRIFANTNNSRGISGDSYGLLLRAGAAVRDLEFVQFYPCQLTHPFKAALGSSVFGDGAVLRNRHGERFMPLYDPIDEDRATRDVMSRAIFHELQKGNGVEGEVYIDCTAVAETVMEQKYGILARELRKHGVDPAKDWIRASVTTHFLMGGAEIDSRCRTSVEGLYAAGEATGGVHGANRLAGNAMTETIVFGPIAGAEAAAHAVGRPRRTASPVHLLGIQGGRSIPPLEELRGRLRRSMWEEASLVRSDASLRRALAVVREVTAEVEGCAIPSWEDVVRVEEVRSMALASEALLLSALERRESRGAHFREDYPESSSEWVGSNRVRLTDRGLSVEFVPKAK